MLRTRVITAVVLLAVLLPVLFSGSIHAIAVLGLIFMAAACWEWARMVKLGARNSILAATMFSIACAWGAMRMQSAETMVWPIGLAVVSVFFWVFVVPSWIVKPVLKPFDRPQWGLALVGFVVLASAWMSLCLLALSGPVMLLSALAIVWVSDIAAYFSGRAFGRRKLAPLVSPGKTWEGVYGAVVACLLLVFAAGMSFGSNWPPSFPHALVSRLSWWASALIVVLLVALGILGDLFESLLKRRAGIKDSSQLLPGHGGVFDRVDAILPVLPAVMLINLLNVPS
jgi:phosphatidate cytidylyltransferase